MYVKIKWWPGDKLIKFFVIIQKLGKLYSENTIESNIMHRDYQHNTNKTNSIANILLYCYAQYTGIIEYNKELGSSKENQLPVLATVANGYHSSCKH